MSNCALNWAWQQKTGSSSRKSVLIAMADRASDDFLCYPSIKRLELDTELNRKTIIKIIDELEQLNFIKFTGEYRGNGVKVYQIIGAIGRENFSDTSTNFGTSTKNDTSTNFSTTSPKNGTPTSTNFSDTSTNFGTQNPKNPNKNHQEPKNNNTAKKFDPLTIELPPNVDYELWQGFVEMRKAIKKPLTEYAVKLLIKDLIGFGNLANQSLEYSIKNNYQGLFMPKQNNQSFTKNNEPNFFEQLAELDKQERMGFGNPNFNPNSPIADADFMEYQ